MNITSPKTWKEKKEIYNDLEKIDLKVLQAYQALFGFDKNFLLHKDKELIIKIKESLEWCTNSLLLIKGRLKSFDLGISLYKGRKWLQFSLISQYIPKKKIISLRETNYRGRNFKKFMEKELGAQAEVATIKGRTTIVSVLIPEEHKNKILY